MFKERQKKKGSMGKEEEELILEVNLISAQGLKAPSGNPRKMYSYAVLWVDPSTKLRTRVDRVGAENPTWNDKFLFRVSPDFIASDTSGVVVEIYAVGYIRDYLVGTVRFLISSCLGKPTSGEIGTPAFTAVQIRRPSGRFHGVLNLAASVSSCTTSSDLEIFHGFYGISLGDVASHRDKKEKDDSRRWRRLSRIGSKASDLSSGAESCELDFSSLDLSEDGSESTCTTASISSTSPSAAVPASALKEWNGVGLKLAGALKELNRDAGEVAGKGGGGMMCGLLLQRRIPSGQNLGFWDDNI
ncbi:OLC1v1038467C1 [Oldenlandia corymbosa var. corymbosa]|uniref:OLC1v1038467C1 n=1 Tax=Oldenlandia corymbosa var. corymbosa TaxID=529605 RepID=A0AAV1CZZ5_OLDCO|nr:OLC1v1038467C1 [Oldenlandia corymbosa var. corymbosa]